MCHVFDNVRFGGTLIFTNRLIILPKSLRFAELDSQSSGLEQPHPEVFGDSGYLTTATWHLPIEADFEREAAEAKVALGTHC